MCPSAYTDPQTQKNKFTYFLLLFIFGSHGILFLSSAISSGLTSLANYYIAHSTPSTKPITFSPRTKANVKRVHTISGVAVDVTSRTTNTIFKLVDGTINRLTGSNTPTSTGRPQPQPQRTASPPPLPPRGKEKGDLSKDHFPPPALPPRPRSPFGHGPAAPPTSPPSSKPRLLNRILASTDIILTALEQSATQLIESGTDAVSRGIGHK